MKAKFNCYRPSIGNIIKVEGKVFLKRQEEENYFPADMGEKLYVGDLIKPDRDSRVLVKCADGKTIWPVPAGIESGVANGCPSCSEPILHSLGNLISPR